MIAKLVVYKCRNCESQNIVKNGHNAGDSQQYWCKDCGKRGVLEPKRGYTEAQKEQILSAYSERSSMRGIQRTFGVSRPILVSWLKKDQANPTLEETLLPAEPDDVLEADEMWSFVQERWNKRWLWTIMCRRTRQIVVFVIGDRSEATCRNLWEQILPTYKGCQSYSDFWDAYQLVFPADSTLVVRAKYGKRKRQQKGHASVLFGLNASRRGNGIGQSDEEGFLF